MDPHDPMISVRDVTKTFKVKATEGGGGPFGGGGSARAVELTALRDISFDVDPGQTVGIVGHNGAGKSTLLKVVAGILQPDAGTVEVAGEITPILGLQAGFAPDLTGLENLYLKGAALGMKDKEVDALVGEIADYARIGDAMYQPLRTYSSGMRMRLAFAITFLETPEVLIVDETVAVGDAVFRRKSMARIEEIKREGATILLVSHGTHLMRGFCDRILVLDGGELLLDAPPGPAIEAYEYLMCTAPEDREAARAHLRNMSGAPGRSERNGQGPHEPISVGPQPETYHRPQGAFVTGARFLGEEGQEVRQAKPEVPPRVECRVMFVEPARDVTVELTVSSVSGREAASVSLRLQDQDAAYIPGGEEVVFTGVLPELPAGDYLASADVFGFMGPDHHHLHGVGSLAALRIARPDAGRVQEGPIFFMHLFGTGEASLRSALEESVSGRLIPLHRNGALDPLSTLLDRDIPPDGIVFGELEFGIHERLGQSPRYAGVIRHPIDRVFSWYHDQASNPGLRHHELAKSMPLEAILEQQRVPEVSNYLTALLAGRPLRGHGDEETFQVALQNLRHFEFLTLTETLADDAFVLESVVGCELPGLRRLGTADRGRRAEMEDALYAVIRHNLQDLRLYELVRTLRSSFHLGAGT